MRSLTHALQNFNREGVDSRAKVTVLGIPQTKSYCELSGIQFLLVKSNLQRLGKTKYLGLGTVDVKIPMSVDYCVFLRRQWFRKESLTSANGFTDAGVQVPFACKHQIPLSASAESQIGQGGSRTFISNYILEL